MRPWICFESEFDLVQFKKRTQLVGHSPSTRLISLNNWMDELGIEPLTEMKEKEAFFTQYLPEELWVEKALWEKAIDGLRLSGAESTEHFEYIFSELPQDPKNQFLKNLSLRWLEEIPVDQKTRLRTLTQELPPEAPSEKVFFVRAAKSSQAMTETLAQIKSLWAQTTGEVQILQPGEWPDFTPSPKKLSPLATFGSALELLDAIADQVFHYIRRKPVEVFLWADPKYETYLKFKLVSKKVDMSQVGIYPWQGSIQSLAKSFFFYYPYDRQNRDSLFSRSETATLHRLGFGSPGDTLNSAGKALSLNRARFFLPDSVLHSSSLLDIFPNPIKAIKKTQPRVTQLESKAEEAAGVFSTKSLSFSSTSLGAYLDCPSQYLYRYVLKLQPKKNPKTESALFFGVLVHKVLELFFKGHETLETAFEKAYTLTLAENPSVWARKEIFKQQWLRIQPSIQAIETQLNAVFGKRTVFSLEYPFQSEQSGVAALGRIDRIDKLSDGSLLLIDYKTGNVDFTPQHMAQGKDWQPWFYIEAALSLNHPVAGFLYYDLKTSSCSRGVLLDKYVPAAQKKSFVRGHVVNEEAFGTLLSEAKSKFLSAVEALPTESFLPKPSSKSCQRCDYLAHCRSSTEIQYSREAGC